jgi:hypothetical protein
MKVTHGLGYLFAGLCVLMVALSGVALSLPVPAAFEWWFDLALWTSVASGVLFFLALLSGPVWRNRITFGYILFVAITIPALTLLVTEAANYIYPPPPGENTWVLQTLMALLTICILRKPFRNLIARGKQADVDRQIKETIAADQREFEELKERQTHVTMRFHH